MILRVEGRTVAGGVIDLRGGPDGDPDARAVVAAVRGEPSPYGAVCPAPGDVHERAGYVHPEMGLRVRTALAAAARSRGLGAPQDEAVADLREEIAELADDELPVREAAAPPDGDRERLRERVAELRGRVRALEETDQDARRARERLREAARELSEVETERVAASQARAATRASRDRRERRLRLEDRAATLEREARAHLVDAVRDRYARAVRALSPESGDPFEVDPVVAALAVLRVARVRAPVVLAVDRFADPGAAARWLDAPVVRL